MKLTNLVMALATFATITLSTSAFIATQDVTSAVIVDKAKHSLDLTTNGLHHISIGEAYIIDRSEAAQINFLRCSFSQPEFRFSWFCHQLKTDGKMTKQSYVALQADQNKYFRENALKSVIYEAQKWMMFSQQSKVGLELKKEKPHGSAVIDALTNGGQELSKKGIETVVAHNIHEAAVESDPILKIHNFSISDVAQRFADSQSPTQIKDFEFISSEHIANEQSKDYVVDLTSLYEYLGLVPEDTDSTKTAGIGKAEHTTISIHQLLLYSLVIMSIIATVNEFTGENKVARQLESWKQSVKVLRKRRYKLLKIAKPFSKEAAEISELDVKIKELDDKIEQKKVAGGEKHE